VLTQERAHTTFRNLELTTAHDLMQARRRERLQKFPSMRLPQDQLIQRQVRNCTAGGVHSLSARSLQFLELICAHFPRTFLSSAINTFVVSHADLSWIASIRGMPCPIKTSPSRNFTTNLLRAFGLSLMAISGPPLSLTIGGPFQRGGSFAIIESLQN